jgi:hypothetical protein
MPRDTTSAPNNHSRRGRARGGFAAPPRTSSRNSAHVHASPQAAVPPLDDPEQPRDERASPASNGSARVSHVSRGSGRGSQPSVGSRTPPLPYATVAVTPVPARYLKYDHSGLPLAHDFEAFTEEDHFLLSFHRMHLRLGEMNRFVLYIHDFSASSDPTWDKKRHRHFHDTYGSDELFRLEHAVYTLLYNIFKTYAETAYIFVEVREQTHRCASRIWLDLMDNFPLDQPLLRMKFLARTILHMSSLQCPDGITYARQVADMANMKQALDGAWFNIDEICVALQLFYFQTQDGLVFKKVTSAIADIVRPLTDASQIDHKVLTAHIIRTFHEYGPLYHQSFQGRHYRLCTT